MQSRKLSMLFILLSCVLLLGCNKKNAEQSTKANSDKADKIETAQYYKDVGDWKAPKPLLAGKKKKHLARPAVEIIDNKIATLYSTPKEIRLNYNGTETVIEGKKGSKYFWLFTNNQTNGIYVFWWNKTKEGKRLYFSGSTDQGKTFSKKVVVNTGGGILPKIDFVSDASGNLTVAYYDERKPPYQIFVNSSSDHGKTWNSEDIRIDNDKNVRMKKVGEKELPMAYAIDPVLTKFNDGKLLLVWEQRKIVDDRSHLQFASRTSIDNGKSWSEETIIYTANGDYPVEYAVANNGKDAVIVAAFSTTSGLLALLTHNESPEKALEWSSLGFAPGTSKVNEISVLNPAISNDILKVSYAFKKTQSTKYSVEVASLSLKEGKWKNIFRLDRGKSQPVKMKATFNDLKVLPNGEFVTVWQDYRRIIPMLMLDYTANKGENWQMASIPLTRGGLSEIKNPKIHVGTDNIWLIFEWYVQRGKKLPRLSYLKIPIDKETGLLKAVSAPVPEKLSADELKSKLTKRVKALMDLRVKKEWDKTWEFMDPVYQLVTTKNSWLSKMGYLIYDDYKIARVQVDGIFATVELDVTVSLRQQLRNEEIMEPSPPKKTHTTTKWLYFYDTWYFYPASSFTPHLQY